MRFDHVVAIVQHPVQSRMGVRYVITHEIIVDAGLPVASDVVLVTSVEYVVVEWPGAQPRVNAIHQLAKRHHGIQRRKHHSVPFRDLRFGQPHPG